MKKRLPKQRAFDTCMVATDDPTLCIDQFDAMEQAFMTWFWNRNGAPEEMDD